MRSLREAVFAATFCLAATAVPAQHDHSDVLAEAGELVIRDGYARAAGAAARTGAGYLSVTNTGSSDDRLIEARGDVAARVELHTTDVEDDVARMREVAEGIPIPAGETVVLEPGGLHVMFMGLARPLEQGDAVSLTLVFEAAGEISVELPVDLERGGAHGHHDGENGMDHGTGR